MPDWGTTTVSSMALGGSACRSIPGGYVICAGPQPNGNKVLATPGGPMGLTSSSVKGAASTLGVSIAVGISLIAGMRQARSRRAQKVRRQQASSGQKVAVALPRNLYELLGVAWQADAASIRSAYLARQKVFHPDVAGEDGQAMSTLLNNAYAILSDPPQRESYNRYLGQMPQLPAPRDRNGEYTTGPSRGPNWKWMPKTGNKGARPMYTGQPRSRSLHNRVNPEDRGEKWKTEKFVFVDEFRCITCWNCVQTAPRTFCIDADHGRARVFAQWGNTEEDMDWAVVSCPVDCISWHTREELQALEYMTANVLHDVGGPDLPPMNIHRITDNWRRHREEQEKSRAQQEKFAPTRQASAVQDQIADVVNDLPHDLKQVAGWA